jgi:hypothetical protein
MKHFSFEEEYSEMLSQMSVGHHIKYRRSCQILLKLESSRQIFEKYSNIKFNENPSGGSEVVPCEQADRQT